MNDADAIARTLAGSTLRTWVELGRARMPIGDVVGLAAGAVVELDREADEPVDIYVNGLRYAVGRLLVDEHGEWAVRIEALVHGCDERSRTAVERPA